MNGFTTRVDLNVGDVLAQAVEAGLQAAADHLLATANQTVPLDQGPLQESGTVTPAPGAAVVSYDTAYAVRQHEDTSLNHAPGRRARWLELAADEERSELDRLVERAARKGTRQ